MIVWHVYQLRSETELLYVGHTRWLRHRLQEHRREKPWWPEVTGITPEAFNTEDEARQREKELWSAGRPKYNKVSPFRTPEEFRAHSKETNQVALRSPDHVAKQRLYHQKWRESPGNRAREAEYTRRYILRRRGRGRGRGPGPGQAPLF